MAIVLGWFRFIQPNHPATAAADNGADMAAMGMASTNSPWTSHDVLFAFVMWTVMMAAMMLPSAMPVLLLAAKAPAAKQTGRASTALLFGAGYFLVWVGFSAAATLAQWALHDAAMLSPAMAAASPRLAGAILIAAGLYQLTPFKHACLVHCRSPLDFLMSHWRTGHAGAFRMGLHHGAYCLGCCWLLMAVLFAVGVMNLLWVAALAAFVLVEKYGPAPTLISRVAGTALIIFGLIRLIGWPV